MLLPDTVGTGGDSHTRFPIGISFPAGSGLVAFAAATGVMPLDMPESVLVRFKGKMQPGITLRDLVNAIPLLRHQAGPAHRREEGQEEHLLRPHPRNRGTARPQGRAGLRAVRRLRRALAPPAARCTSTRRRSSNTCDSNVALMKWMIADGYQDARTLQRRIEAHGGLARRIRSCSRADADAEYAAVIEIDLADDQRADRRLPERSGRREDCCPKWPARRSTRSSSAPA